MNKEDILHAQLLRLDSLQSPCINCGLCAEVCPTYQESGWEHESPRGRIRLARDLMNGRVRPESSALETFDHCKGCQACEVVCPTSVQYGALRDTVQSIRQDWSGGKTTQQTRKTNYFTHIMNGLKKMCKRLFKCSETKSTF